MFLLVFGISEGATYGWFTPQKSLRASPASPSGRRRCRSRSCRSRSSPRAALLFAFYRVQRRKERTRADPLFEFSNLAPPGVPLRHPDPAAAGDGPGRVPVRAVGRAPGRAAPVRGRHRSVAGARPGCSSSPARSSGSWLTRRIGTTNVVRVGSADRGAWGSPRSAIVAVADHDPWQLLPGFALFGIGIGFAGSQLNNVILSDVPAERSGAASGANTHGAHDRRRARHRRHQLAAQRADHAPRGRRRDAGPGTVRLGPQRRHRPDPRRAA